MKNFRRFFLSLLFILILSGCQSIKDKTDLIIETENKKLSEFIGKPSKDLLINLGKPDEDYKNEKGNVEFFYKTKKYGISCERKFEINSELIVIGFVSKGCF